MMISMRGCQHAIDVRWRALLIHPQLQLTNNKQRHRLGVLLLSPIVDPAAAAAAAAC
jgi:hypothetical protein